MPEHLDHALDRTGWFPDRRIYLDTREVVTLAPFDLLPLNGTQFEMSSYAERLVEHGHGPEDGIVRGQYKKRLDRSEQKTYVEETLLSHMKMLTSLKIPQVLDEIKRQKLPTSPIMYTYNRYAYKGDIPETTLVSGIIFTPDSRTPDITLDNSIFVGFGGMTGYEERMFSEQEHLRAFGITIRKYHTGSPISLLYDKPVELKGSFKHPILQISPKDAHTILRKEILSTFGYKE